jgi:hypothetical protein
MHTLMWLHIQENSMGVTRVVDTLVLQFTIKLAKQIDLNRNNVYILLLDNSNIQDMQML